MQELTCAAVGKQTVQAAGHRQCVSFFPIAGKNTMTNSDLQKEEFILTYSSRGAETLMAEKA